jgi:hypothetical protein
MRLEAYLFEDATYVLSDFQAAVENCNRDYATAGIEICFNTPIQIRDGHTYSQHIALIHRLSSTRETDFLLFVDLDLTGWGLTSTKFEECVSSAGGNLMTVQEGMTKHRIPNKNLETGYWLVHRAITNAEWRGVISVVSGVASFESIENMLESLGCRRDTRICAFPSNGNFNNCRTREAKLREAIDKYLMSFGTPTARLHPSHSATWF